MLRESPPRVNGLGWNTHRVGAARHHDTIAKTQAATSSLSRQHGVNLPTRFPLTAMVVAVAGGSVGKIGSTRHRGHRLSCDRRWCMFSTIENELVYFYYYWICLLCICVPHLHHKYQSLSHYGHERVSSRTPLQGWPWPISIRNGRFDDR